MGIARSNFELNNVQAKRIIRCFKRGVFPRDHIAFFTVGRNKEKQIVQKHLAELNINNGNHLFVEGNYGTGKSHLLKLVESIAHKNNYGTIWLTLDGYEHAFNHPTRYLFRLTENLRVPNLDICGFYHLCKYWLRNEERGKLIEWAKNSSPRFKYAINNLASPDENWEYCQMYLTCSDYRFRSGRQYFEDYYNLLSSIIDCCQAIGMKGVVFLFDELESIVTLLPNVRSRLLSLEILKNLTTPSIFPNSYFVFSTTPDFGSHLEIYEEFFSKFYSRDYPGGLEFVKKWKREECKIIKLKKLDKPSKRELCEKLTQVHSIAYSWDPSFKFTQEFIDMFCDGIELEATNEREFIKSFINLLELSEQHADFEPFDTIKEGAIDEVLKKILV